MSNVIKDVLEGMEGNYILPLFWVCGEEEGVLREEMRRVYESGIKAVCVEARPHPDYLGPQWWADMDVIMEEARTRGMRVWILDDDHFPTGHAAGKMKEAPRELQRLFLSESHIDTRGPAVHGSFMIEGGEMIAVIAAKRHSVTGELTGEMVDLTAFLKDNNVYWEVPAGFWRIFTFRTSEKGGSPKMEDYLNPLVKESVRILIDTVYEAFFARYAADFGETLAGFFSDEPGFYNDPLTYDFDSKPGKKGASLPWSSELEQQLMQKWGDEYRLKLPFLWHGQQEVASPLRYAYMDHVSRLYAEHFTGQIGDWCRAHGVEYIGHLVEDNNAHARLGCGAGHYFRALQGQDMAGMDIVLWQLVPGFDEMPFTWIAGETDSEFYHYGLAKMTSSLAHIDPKKKGRAMAEVFGAYGWAEGLKLMKWMTDHLLVRGINHFVPHAFSAKEFPDTDCPPHLYAQGQNPQYRYYRELNRYTNRMCHLLSGGRHIASAAVLYHAEAEWSGEAMFFHKPVKELLRSQIDCDVLPADALIGLSGVQDRQLSVGQEQYDCLIIPYSEALPLKLLERLEQLAGEGLPVIFIEGLSRRTSEGMVAAEVLRALTASSNVEIIALQELADSLHKRGFYDIRIIGNEPYLRLYHVEYDDCGVYMFTNEHPDTPVCTQVKLKAAQPVVVYDAYRHLFTKAHITESEAGGITIELRLSPYESVVLLTGTDISVAEPVSLQGEQQRLEGAWTVSTATAEQYPVFTNHNVMHKLLDMSAPEWMPLFSGTIKYEAEFQWTPQVDYVQLDLGEVFETAQVWINGTSAGIAICPPYRMEIAHLLEQGKNTIVVEVTNTLAKAMRDPLSRFVRQEGSGLIGPVKLFY